MILSGKLQEVIINPSGMEGSIRLLFKEPVNSLWCYVLLLDDYNPNERPNTIKAYNEQCDEPVLITIGEERNFELSIIFVNEYSIISQNEESCFEQPKSSTIQVKAIVEKVIDENTLLCEISGIGSGVLINLEIKANEVHVGDRIKFSGEIKAEPVQIRNG